MLEEEKSNKQIGKFHSFFFCLFSKNLLEQDCNLEYYLISYLEDYPYSKTMDVCKDQKLLVVSLDQHRALHLQVPVTKLYDIGSILINLDLL